LWPLGGHDENVILMLSDAAPYMVKTAEVLNPLKHGGKNNIQLFKKNLLLFHSGIYLIPPSFHV